LECSRPGAAAVALWTTQRLLPLKKNGEFANGLSAGRTAALDLYRRLADDSRFAPLFEPELDIVVWAMRAMSASESSNRARRIFESAAQQDLHLALASFPREMLERSRPVENWDANTVTCLRACVMKPEHQDWMPEIWKRLVLATDMAGA